MLSDEAMAGVVDDYDYWHLPKLLLAPPDWYVTALINVRMHLISQYFHGYSTCTYFSSSFSHTLNDRKRVTYHQ